MKSSGVFFAKENTMSQPLPRLTAACNYSGSPAMGWGTTASLVPAGNRLDFVQEAGEYRQRVPLRATSGRGVRPGVSWLRVSAVSTATGHYPRRRCQRSTSRVR